MSDQQDIVTTVDGRDALAFVIIRPGTTEGSVSLEAAARGISKKEAARVLRWIAARWELEEGPK